ncbi:MAG TPA: hypothetical protein VFL97_05055 [Nitrococcus sp.]|nr:hypothetical protein [Nitrococcus sp.]
MPNSTEQRSVYGLDEMNVLFMTVDCCRADTFETAQMPYIKSLGAARPAKTSGTFTLPAHMGFLGGYLPIDQTTREPYYNPNIRQLWRLDSGRSRDLASVGIRLEGANVVEGYRRLGYYALGAGGVRWFRNEMLQSPFDDFIFYGPDDATSVFAPRRAEDFALNHQNELLDRINRHERSLLFINCLETHVPYDTAEVKHAAGVWDIIRRGELIWGCKTPSRDVVNVSSEELASLHDRQVAALETIDPKVEELIKGIAKPLLFVLCGDHGECFGENDFWGHGYPHDKVMEVPLLITTIER